MDALRRAVRALRSAHVDAEGTLGVSAAQLFVLRLIAAVPGQSMTQLAQRTHTAQSSVSEVVARLVDEQLVVKSVSGADRRRTELALTTRGSAVTARAGRTIQEQLIDALDRLPACDRVALAGLLEEWLRLAGLEDVPPSMFFEATRQDEH
jgi:DNA-binding MarR family transcriptional regulator